MLIEILSRFMDMNSTNVKTLLFILLCSYHVMGQQYDTAIGFRIGTDFGIALDQRFANKNTIQVLYEDGLFDSNRNFSLIARQHLPLITKGFNVYLGAGFGYYWEYDSDNILRGKSAGIPFTAGAELTLGRLCISADMLPMLLFRSINDQKFVRSSGFSVKYVLIKRKKKKFRDIFGGIFGSKN